MSVIPEPSYHPDETVKQRSGGQAARSEHPPFASREISGLSESEISALAAASGKAHRNPTAPIHRRKLRWGLTFLFSMSAGLAAGLLERPSFRCEAVFATPTLEDSWIDPEVMRSDLASHLTETFSASQGDNQPQARWTIHPTADRGLSVTLIGTEPQRNLDLLGDVASGFIAAMRRRVGTIRETPSETERVLEQYVSGLRQDLAQADQQVQAALEGLPRADPRLSRGTMLNHWEQTRDEFDVTRSSLVEASSTLRRLEEEPEPTHGLVSSEDREAAIAADKALKNDLEELAVNLSEVRLHLLNVGMETPPLLESLVTATASLRGRVASSVDSETAEDVRGVLAGLSKSCDVYREALTGFAATWRRCVEQVRSQEVNPRTASLLEVHHEISQRLADFLYQASAPLTAMRTAVNGIGQLRGNNARRQVLQSALVREFQLLQTAHHRFEFAAGQIAGAANFRLDAALRSGRGLHRRTEARLRDIDTRLEKAAAERARKRHAAALESAEQLASRIRNATDQTVDRLVELQERLNETLQESDSFHENLRLLEVATGRLAVTHEHLSEMEEQLALLRDERLGISPDPGVRLVSCGVVGGSQNRMARVRTGGITFALVFVALMFGQWWMRR